MKDKNKLVIAVVAVVAIVLLVVGATFAYWTWISNEEQRTNVAFTLTQETLEGGLYANLDGSGETTATALKPAACDSSNAVKKTVTINYYNETTQSATISAILQVSAFTLRDTAYVPTTEDLEHLKYALTTTDTLCTTDVAKDLNENAISGDFSDVTFENGVAQLPVTLFTQTFTAPAKMTEEATQTYYLWIWLDSAYAHENVGSNNTDPMQSLEFTTQWSGVVSQNAA